MSEFAWLAGRDVEGGEDHDNDNGALLTQGHANDRGPWGGTARPHFGGSQRAALVPRRHWAWGASLLPFLLAATLLAWHRSAAAGTRRGGALQQADFQSLENKQLAEALEGSVFATAEVVKAYGEWRSKNEEMLERLDGLYNGSLYKPREAEVSDKQMKAMSAFPLGSLTDINGSVPCMHDEEVYAGVCYKQCSLLTAGEKPIRTSAFSCCAEEPCTWFNTKWSFGVCSGFSVRGDSLGRGCGHVPGKCLETEELQAGQCYQKCSLLTNGSFPFRLAASVCCKARSLFACLDPVMYKVDRKHAVGGRLGNKLIPEKYEEPHPPIQELTEVMHTKGGWVQQLLQSSTEEERTKALEAVKSVGITHNVKKKIMAKKEELREKMTLPAPGAGGGLQPVESSDGKLPDKMGSFRDNLGTEQKSEKAAKELEEMMAGVAQEEKDELKALRTIMKDGLGKEPGQVLPNATSEGMEASANGSSPDEGNTSLVRETVFGGNLTKQQGGLGASKAAEKTEGTMEMNVTKQQSQAGKGVVSSLTTRTGVVSAKDQADSEKETSEILPTTTADATSALVEDKATTTAQYDCGCDNATLVEDNATLEEDNATLVNVTEPENKSDAPLPTMTAGLAPSTTVSE